MIWKRENAFFAIKILDQAAAQDVITLSIAEEVGKTDDIALTLYDPKDAYVRELKFGTVVGVEWGTTVTRRYSKGIVTSMSGSAGDNGVKTTTINVQTIIDNQTAVALHSGRRSDIVTKILLQMGILPINMLVSAMPAIETQLPQMQDDFNFLVGLSRKWGCHFKLSYDGRGFLHAAFCAATELGSFAESIGGTEFFAIKLYYGVFETVGALSDLAPNVRSYSWQYNPVGGAGQGAAITPGVDGMPQLTRYVVEGESVKTYKLNMERCEQAVKQYADDAEAVANFWSRVMAPDVGWNTAKAYYDATDQNTASETFGYKVSCELPGSPRIMAGSMVYFGAGFPDSFGATNRVWWARSVKHSLSASGFTTTIDVVDSTAMTDVGVMLPIVMDYALKEATTR
jgi:hypothetical protein